MLAAVGAALASRVAALKGALSVAEDPDHALEILSATAPQGWRLVLFFPGYASHPNARTGMGTMRLGAIVQTAKGLQAPGGALEDRGALPSIHRLIDDVRQWVSAMRFPVERNVDDHGFALTGSAWIALEQTTTKQHQLDFELQAALAPLVEAGEAVAIYAPIP